MALFGKKKQDKISKYPGIRKIMNGVSAVVMCERESSDAASVDLSTSTADMCFLWSQEKNKGHLNISSRTLISIDSKNAQTALTTTAGLSLSGLRATHFSSSKQSIASMHESLYAAVGKRLPYVLNIVCTATTKATSNHHCSHDDYHSMGDTGFIQFFAHNNQSAADLNLIGRKIAELSLNPVAVAQDGFLTSDLVEPLNLPERELIEEFVGLPDDIITTPTPAQSILFGKTRRRVPETWSVDQPTQTGGSQSPDSYMQTVAGQRPYFFDHVTDITDQCMEEWFELTGRRYRRINQYLCKDADYLIIAQGSVINNAKMTADYLRSSRKLKVGVVNLTVFRPFPGDLLSHIIKGKKGVLVLERTDQPMAEDLPIITEIRSCVSKAIDNGRTKKIAFANYASYAKTTDISPLYSACFGLGGRNIKVSDIIGAVDNMFPEAKQLKFAYLGINFISNKNLSPQQEIQHHSILEAYPEINNLTLTSNESPNLLPEDAKSIRIHSLGGWKNNLLGQDLAQTLFDHFNLEVKARPFYETEKKGQPTTFYLTMASKPFHLNDEYNTVNTVLALAPNVFSHSNPLAGLVENGVFIIQSQQNNANDVWHSFPTSAQKILSDKNISVFFIDAASLAQDELEKENSEINSPFDFQNLIFKSVFFKTTDIVKDSDKNEEQIQSVIGDNPDLIERSYNKLQEIIVAEMNVGDTTLTVQGEPPAPLLLQQKPANESAIANIHRFWNQTGSQYSNKKSAKENLVGPFAALGIVPAATGIFGDMTANRLQHPQWIPENCNACGNCYTSCPDSAIPGLINTVSEVFETNIKRIEKSGHIVKHLRRAIRTVEKKYHELTVEKSVGTTLDPIFAKAIGDTIKEYPEPDQEEVTQEFEWFKEKTGSFKFALTKPYHDDMNSHMPRNGGLFSITINPNSCKGCMECISVCETDALTPESIQTLRDNWAYWLDLPTSNKKYSRIDDLQAKNGVLNTLLLDKKNHSSMQNSDNTRAGSGEKIVLHLFSSTVTALMQPRIEKHIKQLDQLIIELEKHIRLKLVETVDISDIDALETAIDQNQNVDLTLSRLTGTLDKDRATQPIDPKWLRWALQLVEKLKHLRWSYKQGSSGEGRASLGATDGSNPSADWTATFPFNPYPFPWTRHLSQDAPSLTMGLFEGHMVKMAEGFKAIRTAELEIKGKYDKSEHDTFFAHFDWRQFSEEEYLLCPPLVTFGSEGTSFNSGLQSLSSSLMSGQPIKILVLDNQPSENSDSLRKELGLITMAHRTAFVHQSSFSNSTHCLSGFIDGLNYRGPALWSIYASSQPENGMTNSSLNVQSKIAVKSRAYPLMTFDPRLGESWEECISLLGNPDIDQDWITYSLAYTDEYGNNFSMDVPLTYADWALTESTFAHHFKPLPADTKTNNMALLTEYLEMDSHGQANNRPFIWAVHPQSNHLLKVIVSSSIVKATQNQKYFWHTLKGLSGDSRVEVDTQAIADQAKAEMAQTITEGLMSMVGGDASALTRILAEVPAVSAKSSVVPETKPKPIVKEKKATPKAEEKPKTEAAKKPPGEAGKTAHEAVWIETPDCTTCDECVDIAPSMFQYNEDKKAIVIDPTKGTFEDIVRSAEKCTAVIIHPGTPWNPDEPNLEQLIKRAEQFQ